MSIMSIAAICNTNNSFKIDFHLKNYRVIDNEVPPPDCGIIDVNSSSTIL